MEIDKNLLKSLFDFPLSTVETLLEYSKLAYYPKKFILFTDKEIAKKTYFLLQGAAKAFLHHDGKEVIFWFGFEGDILFSYNSLTYQQPGYENMSFLEKSMVLEINNRDLLALYEKDLTIANWGRKMVEKELIRTEKRWIDWKFKPAKIRYEELIDRQPHILQKASLGEIASYLGISQVSLSRIRAGKQGSF